MSCTPSAFTQPFTRWLDSPHYVLAPGGAFEATTASWNLTGGAATQAGNEPYYLHGRSDSRSLALPLGSSATSRQMCVGLDYPTMRFVAKGTRGAQMRVEVLAGSKLGGTLRLPIGVITGTGNWQVSPILLIDANLFARARRHRHGRLQVHADERQLDHRRRLRRSLPPALGLLKAQGGERTVRARTARTVPR